MNPPRITRLHAVNSDPTTPRKSHYKSSRGKASVEVQALRLVCSWKPREGRRIQRRTGCAEGRSSRTSVRRRPSGSPSGASRSSSTATATPFTMTLTAGWSSASTTTPTTGGRRPCSWITPAMSCSPSAAVARSAYDSSSSSSSLLHCVVCAIQYNEGKGVRDTRFDEMNRQRSFDVSSIS